MLKGVVDFAKQVFTLTRSVQQNQTDIADLREEVKDLRQEVNQLRQEMAALTRVVERLMVELQHDRRDAEREREMQRLRLENILLRFERGLPPVSNPDCVSCQHNTPTQGPRVCPLCGHQFKGSGWDGIDR